MRVLFVFLLIFFTAFAALGAPAITAVSPNTGWPFGDTRVSVIGSGFSTSDTTIRCDQAGVVCPVRVWFGDNTGAVIAVLPYQIDVYAPAHDPAVVDVRVELVNGGGEATLPNGFQYRQDANPGPINYIRYLVPLSGPDIEGAHGSLWVSELYMFNDADDATVYPVGVFCNPLSLGPAPCPVTALAPKTGGRYTLWPLPNSDVTGSFLYIPRPLAELTEKHLRAYDTSRSDKSLGAEVPIVSADEFSPHVVIVNVPVDASYRASLRIYGTSEAPEQVVMKVLGENGTDVLEERTVDLAGIATTEPSLYPVNPAYARVDPITDAVRASGARRVRIELQSEPRFPSEYPNPIWGFLTITNNDTQEVTVISPQP